MKRPADMPFGIYKLRRKIMNQQLKERLRGKVVWDSAVLGTYRKIKP